MSTNYFIKLMENSPLRDKILRERPSAFCLLTLVVIRARKADLIDENGNKIHDEIEIGEALIGDYETYGATQQIYRSDKKYLQGLKILTYRTTNKGTIAKLINRAVFDIERVKTTNEVTTKSTHNQRATNDPATTKQEDRSKNNNISTSVVLPVNDKEIDPASPDSITPQIISSIAKKYRVSEEDVKNKVFPNLKAKAEGGYEVKNWVKKLDMFTDRALNQFHYIQPLKTFEETVREQTGDPDMPIF